MARHSFNPPGELPASPRYSFGASAGGLVFTAGIVAIDEDGATQHVGDAGAQTRHVLDALGRILAARGCTFDDVLQAQVFLKTMDDYAAMNAAYAPYFENAPPPRYCVTSALVRDDWLVEIALVAMQPGGAAA